LVSSLPPDAAHVTCCVPAPHLTVRSVCCRHALSHRQEGRGCPSGVPTPLLCLACYMCAAGSPTVVQSQCPVGRYSYAGASSCSLCAAGNYGDAPGLTTETCSGEPSTPPRSPVTRPCPRLLSARPQCGCSCGAESFTPTRPCPMSPSLCCLCCCRRRKIAAAVAVAAIRASTITVARARVDMSVGRAMSHCCPQGPALSPRCVPRAPPTLDRQTAPPARTLTTRRPLAWRVARGITVRREYSTQPSARLDSTAMRLHPRASHALAVRAVTSQ
jgi:hypothetical protein